MAELDLDALEQAAREAGGGCWFSAGWTVGSRGFEVGDLKSRDRICSDATERCAKFIAAANPATILELLGRLKAAEKDITMKEEVIDLMGVVVKRLDAQCDAAEKERDSTMRLADSLALALNTSNHERDNLRAKIEAMERQGPGFRERCTPSAPTGCSNRFPLYTLPGAQPAPSVPDGWLHHAARMAALARKLREPDWHFESIREMQRELCALEEAALAAAPEAKP